MLTQGSFRHPKALLGCQEEKAGIWVWDLSASTSIPFRGSLQPSVVGTSLSWWRERHDCGTIPAMKPSVFLTGIVFHLLKHSGSSSFGNLWSTKVKLARTPGFDPNCTLLLSQVPPEHRWLSKCSTENAPAQPLVITSEGPGSREKLGTAERQGETQEERVNISGKVWPSISSTGWVCRWLKGRRDVLSCWLHSAEREQKLWAETDASGHAAWSSSQRGRAGSRITSSRLKLLVWLFFKINF